MADGAPEQTVINHQPPHRQDITRRAFLRLSALAGTGLAVDCQLAPVRRDAARPPPRVGFVILAPESAYPFLQPFRQALQSHGYTEGQNVLLDVRSAEGQLQRFPELIKELLAMPSDVLVLGESVAVAPAAEATTTVPLVTLFIGDPVALGYAASLARPTRNITGVTVFNRPLSAKRLELLQQCVPSISRVGLLRNEGYSETANDWQEFQDMARSKALQSIPLEIASRDDLQPAIAAGINQGMDSLVVVPDSLTNNLRPDIIQLAEHYSIPAIYPNRESVAQGGLMSYGGDRQYNARRAAYYVARLIQGTQPTDLPFEQPARFELGVNLQTAQALGIAVPNQLARTADFAVQ